MKLPYERTVLPNGVRLLLIPMDGLNSVATSVMVAVGSRYETPQVNGISHFLEHMVFKGTKKFPTTDDVNIIERSGGLQNAYTDVDITNFHNKVLSTDWRLALEVNRELALAPLLSQEHVDRERNVIIEEMKRYEDEPAVKVSEVFHKLLYPGTSLGMRIIGEEASLRAIISEKLKQYHDKWYTPERIVVVLSGNLNPPAGGQISMVKEATEDWFGKLKGHATADFEKVSDEQNKPQIAIVTKPDAQQAHLTLGIRTFTRNSEARFAWSVFNLLMGVSFTSRLFKEIREKRGLCYHIRSGSDNWVDVGYWSIYAGVATEKVKEAVEAILVELGKAVEKGISEDEVRVAKKRLTTMITFKSEDPEFVNEFYGRQELFNEPILTVDDYLKKINSVTKNDINRLLKKYITKQTLNLALVWNKPEDEKVAGLLKL